MNTKHFQHVLPKAAFAAALAVGLGLPMTGTWSTVSIVRAGADVEDLPEVPKDAKKMEQSSDSAMFHVPARGQVWLYDATDKEVVHSITVSPGNTYSFNTKKDQIFVNETPAQKTNLNPDHKYQIYYVDWAARKAAKGNASAKEDKDEEESWSVPKGAKHVAQGKAGENVKFEPEVDGTVYLYDRTDGNLVNTFRVHKGDSIVVEPKKDGVFLNDKEILKDAGLKRDNSYRLWFTAKSTKATS